VAAPLAVPDRARPFPVVWCSPGDSAVIAHQSLVTTSASNLPPGFSKELERAKRVYGRTQVPAHAVGDAVSVEVGGELCPG
jgi:hypothetical protein